MSSSLEIAQQSLLMPAEIGRKDIDNMLGQLMSCNIEYGDLYFQICHREFWSLEDGIVKDGNYHVEQGVGVRAVTGEKTGFAYSDDIVISSLSEAVRSARAIAVHSQQKVVHVEAQNQAIRLYDPVNPLKTLADEEKVKLLEKIDTYARRIDSRVEQVMISLVGAYDIVLIAATDGTYTADVRPLVRFNVSVIAAQNGRREQASMGGGGRFGYEYFVDQQHAERYAQEAVRQALVSLDAVDAPAGIMPVVLGPGWPGVLLHEAVGHGLEGDFNRKGTSAFSGRIGEKVASEHCTIVDDGTLRERRGSLTVDDEGTPTQKTVLIENGILKKYMQDKMNARLMGVRPTGNGRRESYGHLPMPRMTNTYMLPGNYHPEEIIASVERGLYAANFSGGQVDITNGKFVFSASEAYLIENGKITRPVKGATLIGNGPEAMTRISMVGNDLQLDSGMGVCGKNGQGVPVGVGQPTLKVDQLTVGGTSA